MLEEGQIFPDFSLSDQDGNVHTLDSIKGSPTILYFYPKDDTKGCTQEACEFNESLPQFTGAKVFGLSPDSVKKHKKFALKYDLQFPLLADEERTLIDPLGLWIEKTFYGRKYMGVDRTTVLLDSEGRIQKVWRKVNPAGHAAEVLAALTV